MNTAETITNGLTSQLELSADQQVVVEQTSGAADHDRNGPLDAAAAVVHALAEPLDFPPLSRATVSGDRLAIALGEGIPQFEAIVAGAIRAAEHAGIETEAIAIVVADRSAAELLRSSFENELAASPRVVLHDPADDKQLCFVGSSQSGMPLLVNRTLYDADIILPIGCARLPGVLGSGGVHDCLFPQFFDDEALEKFRAPSGLEVAGLSEQRRRQTEEAGWLLGAAMVLQVVPGRHGHVAQVVAGTPEGAARETQQLCRSLWQQRVAQRATLVIATLGGGQSEQTWDSVARALAAAEVVLDEGGAIAICTQLDRLPGKSLGRLIDVNDLADAEYQLRNEYDTDTWSAWRLAHALQDGPVYFLSRLSDETVEDLGMAPVRDMTELGRLASRHDSCIVLEDAEHAVVNVEVPAE